MGDRMRMIRPIITIIRNSGRVVAEVEGINKIGTL